MSKPELVKQDVLQDAPKLPVRVLVAHLQTGVTIEGHCSSDSNFNPQKFPHLRMTLTTQGLLLDFPEHNGNKARLAIVPTTNVKAMLLG